MSDIKQRVSGLEPSTQPRNISEMVDETGNIYETINIIAARARQTSDDLKKELHSKLEEFAVQTETLEEVQENKEQIEISRYYERLPNPATIATYEYLNGELFYEYPEGSRKNVRRNTRTII